MTSRPILVEFCGLPGSGKSTIAAYTCRALLAAGVAAHIADAQVSATVRRPERVLRRSQLAAAQAVTRPVAAARAARLVAATRPAPRDGIALLAQWLMLQRLLSHARCREGVTLVEEGVVQTLWSLALRARADALEQMRSSLAPGNTDLVVVVDTPTGVILDRLDRRPSRHSRTQSLDPASRGAELDHGRGLLDGLLSSVPQGRLTLLNDGSTPVAELGQHIASWVLRTM